VSPVCPGSLGSGGKTIRRARTRGREDVGVVPLVGVVHLPSLPCAHQSPLPQRIIKALHPPPSTLVRAYPVPLCGRWAGGIFPSPFPSQWRKGRFGGAWVELPPRAGRTEGSKEAKWAQHESMKLQYYFELDDIPRIPYSVRRIYVHQR